LNWAKWEFSPLSIGFKFKDKSLLNIISLNSNMEICPKCCNRVEFREVEGGIVCPVCGAEFHLIELDRDALPCIPDGLVPEGWLEEGSAS